MDGSNLLQDQLMHNQFHGACLDTGAQRSVIGMKQAQHYCKRHSLTFNYVTESTTQFRFGDGSFASKGKIRVRIPTPDCSYIQIDVDTVDADVPLLIGLDILDAHLLVVNNVTNKLESHRYNWSLPITRKLGHLYLCWGDNEVLFTRQEIVKLHRHFRHPSAGKLYSLMKRARPNQ